MNVRIALVMLAAVAWAVPSNAEDQFTVKCRMYKLAETAEEKAEAPKPVAPEPNAVTPKLGLVEGSLDGDSPDANGFYKDGDHLVWLDSDSGEERRYELMAMPRLTVLADQAATIKIGQEVPYVDAESGKDEVLFKDVGTTLNVIVHHSAENRATLAADFEIVSRLSNDADTGQPRFSTSEWSTESAVPYGAWWFQRVHTANGEEHLWFLSVTRSEIARDDAA